MILACCVSLISGAEKGPTGWESAKGIAIVQGADSAAAGPAH